MRGKDIKMPAMTRVEIQDFIGKLASESAEFSRALVTDPKGAIQSQLNTILPEGLTVKAGVETADPAYMVISHSSEEGELDEADLEQLAGGVHAKDEESEYCAGPVKQHYMLSAGTSGTDSSN